MQNTIRLVSAATLMSLSAVCFAQPTVLVCTGWLPFYSAWSAPINPNDKTNPARLTVKLDQAAQSMDVQLPHAGALSGPMKVFDDAYTATFRLEGAAIGPQPIKQVFVTINRFTGEAYMEYARTESRPLSGEGTVAFAGECAPAKLKF